MNPYIEDVLASLSQKFGEEFAPVVQPQYLGAQLSFSAMLMSAMAEEWDRGAHRLREGNRAMRELFSQAAPLVGNEDQLAEAIARYLASGDDDIRISALRATNEAMRETLSLVHARIETIDAIEARALDEAIWQEFRADTIRRRLEIEPY